MSDDAKICSGILLFAITLFGGLGWLFVHERDANAKFEADCKAGNGIYYKAHKTPPICIRGDNLRITGRE